MIVLVDSDRAHGGYKGSLADQQIFESFVETMTTNLITYPVYFTFETDDILTWYSLLAKQEPSLDNLVVQVQP